MLNKLQNKLLNILKLILFLFSIDQDGRKYFSVMKVQMHPVIILKKYSQGMSFFILLIQFYLQSKIVLSN
jgi:2-hydroxy-3-keto-5-methylthiopentenyl-1-phosphate phosphatase